MKKITALAAVAVLVGSVFVNSVSAQWNHDPTSPTGPDNWGELDPVDRTCGAILEPGGPFVETGKKQSPVDIVNAVPTLFLSRLVFVYKAAPLAVENTGHVVEVPYLNGSRLRVGRDSYYLEQFHFHTPSEHTIGGVQAAMEVHFVHKNNLGDLAVVGVLMNATTQGNPEVDKIFEHVPEMEGEPEPVPGESIDAWKLLPESKRSYYTYSGSLTTPHCTEGVRWFVLTDPIEVSQTTVDEFRAIVAAFPGYNGYEYNNRPVRPLNGRPLLKRVDMSRRLAQEDENSV
jgi:carbonic anhydrase